MSRPEDARPGVPPELAELDGALEGVQFEPRASLGPEIAGRVRQGERSTGAVPPRRGPAVLWAAAAALVVCAAGLWTTRGVPKVTVDRCCYDLDGGGVADDGVVLLARRDAEVRRLRVYEDLDGSRDFSHGDLIRLDRGPTPAMHRALDGGLVTTDHCCLDFDGGGYADDGLLVIGVPPNRVVMAAIYERPRGFAGADPAAGWPLR